MTLAATAWLPAEVQAWVYFWKAPAGGERRGERSPGGGCSVAAASAPPQPPHRHCHHRQTGSAPVLAGSSNTSVPYSLACRLAPAPMRPGRLGGAQPLLQSSQTRSSYLQVGSSSELNCAMRGFTGRRGGGRQHDAQHGAFWGFPAAHSAQKSPIHLSRSPLNLTEGLQAAYSTLAGHLIGGTNEQLTLWCRSRATRRPRIPERPPRS